MRARRRIGKETADAPWRARHRIRKSIVGASGRRRARQGIGEAVVAARACDRGRSGVAPIRGRLGILGAVRRLSVERRGKRRGELGDDDAGRTIEIIRAMRERRGEARIRRERAVSQAKISLTHRITSRCRRCLKLRAAQRSRAWFAGQLAIFVVCAAVRFRKRPMAADILSFVVPALASEAAILPATAFAAREPNCARSAFAVGQLLRCAGVAVDQRMPFTRLPGSTW